MKTIGVFTFLFTCSLTYCQNWSGYINSIKVDDTRDYYIKGSNYDTVYLGSESGKGIIYIKTKNIYYLSLADVLKKHIEIENTAGSIVYKVNGRCIENKETVKIDSSFFIYVYPEEFTEVKYIDEKYRDLKIVNIFLSDTLRKPKIMLR